MLAPPSGLTARPIAIANWLLAVAALVFAMVVVGGITRLTESGLSITRWDLVTGTLPPLSDKAWNDAFDALQGDARISRGQRARGDGRSPSSR